MRAHHCDSVFEALGVRWSDGFASSALDGQWPVARRRIPRRVADARPAPSTTAMEQAGRNLV